YRPENIAGYSFFPEDCAVRGGVLHRVEVNSAEIFTEAGYDDVPIRVDHHAAREVIVKLRPVVAFLPDDCAAGAVVLGGIVVVSRTVCPDGWSSDDYMAC